MDLDEVIKYVKQEAPRFGLKYREGYVSHDDLKMKKLLFSHLQGHIGFKLENIMKEH